MGEAGASAVRGGDVRRQGTASTWMAEGGVKVLGDREMGAVLLHAAPIRRQWSPAAAALSALLSREKKRLAAVVGGPGCRPPGSCCWMQCTEKTAVRMTLPPTHLLLRLLCGRRTPSLATARLWRGRKRPPRRCGRWWGRWCWRPWSSSSLQPAALFELPATAAQLRRLSCQQLRQLREYLVRQVQKIPPPKSGQGMATQPHRSRSMP